MRLWGSLLVIAMAADFITFTLFVPHVGIGAELNPIMAAGYINYGLGIVLLLKLIVTFTILLLLVRVERVRLRRFAAIVGIMGGLLGTFGNITAAIAFGVFK